MTGKTHLVTGVTVGLVLIQVIPVTPVQAIAIVAACTIGSLAPDLDHPQSVIHSFIPGLRWMSLITGHRGILHALIVPALLVLSYWTTEPIKMLYKVLELTAPPMPQWLILTLFALGIGWTSHLILDALTPRGIPLFYPYPSSFRLLPKLIAIRTGGLFELIFLIAMCVAFGATVKTFISSF